MEPVRRTPEIEDPSNRWIIHPLAACLVPRFAAMRISANAVSIAGMACGVLAGFAYRHYADARYAVVGFALMIAWHVLDGADGQLARLTRTQSELGKVLDGICDYVTFISVYVALAIAMRASLGSRVWALVATAGLGHAIQAAAYEAQREDYRWFATGSGSVRADAGPPAGVACPATQSRVRRAFNGLHRVYQRVQRRTTRGQAAYRARLAAVLERSPERAENLRERYRAAFAPALRRWSVLSSNYRTLGLFLCAAFKVPALYFGLEIVGLSAILVLLSVAQRLRYARFLRTIEAECASR